MATSGSSDYNRTAQQLFRGALRLLGVIQSGESPSHEEERDGIESLELMIKSLQGMGYRLWTFSEGTLFLTLGTDSYQIPNSRFVSDFRQAASTDDAPSGATTIEVGSIAGISDGDVLGIRLRFDAIHWTTVSGNPAGATLTFADAIPSAVGSGADVFAYTESTDLITVKPLRIEDIRRRISNQDTPIIEYGREDYFMLPNKINRGTPTQYYYQPLVSSGKLYVWPTGDSVDETLKITYIRPIQDFDNPGNTPDLPQEWLEALKYQLALRLAPEYGVPVRPDVYAMAEGLLDSVTGWDVEPTSVMMQPDSEGWG